MEIYKLQQLLSEMSLQEKIGQMVQLTGAYFDKDAVLTGVVGEQLPPEWIIRYAGSVLGVIGKEKIYDIQSKYMEQHPHHIPLIFMADVIHGCRTIFPIPLGQACSFHPELVSEAASIAASEASSEGLKATFSPMIDVSRDPRWGYERNYGKSNGRWLSAEKRSGSSSVPEAFCRLRSSECRAGIQ